MRYAQAYLLDMQHGVFGDVQVAIKTKVLLVVGGKGDTDT